MIHIESAIVANLCLFIFFGMLFQSLKCILRMLPLRLVFLMNEKEVSNCSDSTFVVSCQTAAGCILRSSSAG